MLIDCSHCQSRVAAVEIGHHQWFERGEPDGPQRIVLASCPACKNALVGKQEGYSIGYNEYDWSNLMRLWPDGEDYLHPSIPHDVRSSLVEAKLCFQAKAYSACAVMCGRAIEAMCVAHTSEKTLHKGLAAMRDSRIIDGRLFEWGDSLRQERNIGAHATGQSVSRDDSRDVLEFATAICEYVYVLADRYQRYKSRKLPSPQKP
jgi:hypothetical protein